MCSSALKVRQRCPCAKRSSSKTDTETEISGNFKPILVLSRLYSLLIWINISSLAFWASSWSGQSPPPYRHSRSAAHKANSMLSQQMETCLQMGCILITLYSPTATRLALGVNCSMWVAISMFVYPHPRLNSMACQPMTATYVYLHHKQQRQTCKTNFAVVQGPASEDHGGCSGHTKMRPAHPTSKPMHGLPTLNAKTHRSAISRGWIMRSGMYSESGLDQVMGVLT